MSWFSISTSFSHRQQLQRLEGEKEDRIPGCRHASSAGSALASSRIGGSYGDFCQKLDGQGPFSSLSPLPECQIIAIRSHCSVSCHLRGGLDPGGRGPIAGAALRELKDMLHEGGNAQGLVT